MRSFDCCGKFCRKDPFCLKSRTNKQMASAKSTELWRLRPWWPSLSRSGSPAPLQRLRQLRGFSFGTRKRAAAKRRPFERRRLWSPWLISRLVLSSGEEMVSSPLDRFRVSAEVVLRYSNKTSQKQHRRRAQMQHARHCWNWALRTDARPGSWRTTLTQRQAQLVDDAPKPQSTSESSSKKSSPYLRSQQQLAQELAQGAKTRLSLLAICQICGGMDRFASRHRRLSKRSDLYSQG